jgi:hypothetical protein
MVLRQRLWLRLQATQLPLRRPSAPVLLRRPFQPLLVWRALVVVLALLGARPAAAAPSPLEIRCGWLVNPTPANIWLRDRDREWIIGVQGGDQLGGDWPWPAFAPGQWQELNGHYGRGCACIRGRVDPDSGRVVEIQHSWPRPLQACREDPALGPRSQP